MFAPLFILALAILSIIGASSVAILDQERATVNLASAMSAFYATESTIEEGLYDIRQAKEHPDEKNSNTLIRSHAKQKNDLTKKIGTINVDGLSVELVDREFVDVPKRIGSPIPKSSGEFRLMNIDTGSEILDFYLGLVDTTKDQNISVDHGFLIDVIYFPRNIFAPTDKEIIDFGTVAQLAKAGADKKVQAGFADGTRNIYRAMYYTIKSDKEKMFEGMASVNEIAFTPVVGECLGYSQCFQIGNLHTSEWNYIIRWQSLDQHKVHYLAQVTRADKDKNVAFDDLIEVDSLTATQNMYQRIKQQEASFAPLQPGLSFALFSNTAITK